MCFFTFVAVFFSGLAVYYIINYATNSIFTLTLAVIWLLIVSTMIRAACKDHGGVRQFIVDQIGLLSRNQFADLFMRESGVWVLRLGYRAYGMPVYYGEIPLQHVTSVEWSAGQATSLAGRDMNDWHVILWYKPEPPQTPRFPFGIRPEEDLFVVGESRAKSETAILGCAIVEFLRGAGLRIEQRGRDNCFVACGENENAT